MRCFLGNNVEYSVAFCLGHDTENFGRVLVGAPLFFFSLGGKSAAAVSSARTISATAVKQGMGE